MEYEARLLNIFIGEIVAHFFLIDTLKVAIKNNTNGKDKQTNPINRSTIESLSLKAKR